MCPYELALKLHELGVNSESEFYFVKEMKGGGTQIDSVTQNTMRYSYRKEGDLIPAYMSHELGEILPSMINISKSKIWDDWLQLTQYFLKINLCRIIQTRYGLTQLWFIPLIERIQNACCKHHNDVDMSWEDFVKKMSE